MGVADNRTYKNEYHFTDDSKPTSEQHPSIEKDPKVNTTIKKNPYRSNVEIEGGEVVLQPDLSALFKAKGKRHAQGGMDVLLKPDSFVFSDYKELEIDEDEAEDFELKEGGTPAKTLKKNVDIKHYNTLVQNIDNPYKDDLAKKSSARMLEKYIKMLGNIAYLQENKKGFPQGLPDFSIGTAPMENEELEDQMDENKQYMKAGGMTKNPYAKYGLLYSDSDCPCGRDANGKCLPCDDKTKWEPYKKNAKVIGTNPSGYNEVYSDETGRLYQGYAPSSYSVPRGIPGGSMNDAWKKKIQSMIDAGATLDDLVKQKHGTKQGLTSMFDWSKSTTGKDDFVFVPKVKMQPSGWYNDKTGAHYRIPDNMRGELEQEVKQEVSGPTVEKQEYTPQGVKRADWQFTPWQKLSQAYNWGQYAGVQRYMPFRSRYNATYVDPALVNPEQTIGDIKGLSSQQLSQLNTLSPILRNAQAAQLFGSVQSQIPGIRSQYDNQNAQILNQTRQYNNQVKNNESLVNMGNDQQYYTQAVEGRKNFENMRTYTANQAMNNVMRDAETNQKLAYNLLTQNNPAYNFDWKTGRFTRTNKSILDVQNSGKGDYLENFVGEITKDWDKMDTDQRLNFLKILTAKGFTPSGNTSNPFAGMNLPFKKGGKIKNPYK